MSVSIRREAKKLLYLVNALLFHLFSSLPGV